jgi:hypothetical protein
MGGTGRLATNEADNSNAVFGWLQTFGYVYFWLVYSELSEQTNLRMYYL